MFKYFVKLYLKTDSDDQMYITCEDLKMDQEYITMTDLIVDNVEVEGTVEIPKSIISTCGVVRKEVDQNG